YWCIDVEYAPPGRASPRKSPCQAQTRLREEARQIAQWVGWLSAGWLQLRKAQPPEQNEQQHSRKDSHHERCREGNVLLKINAKPGTKCHRTSACENARWLETPQLLAWNVVQQIEVAGDLDAGEGKAVERETTSKSHHTTGGHKRSADDQ